MRNIGIIQARMASTRLPGKVMEIINGKPMIKWQIERTQNSKIQKIVLATSNDPSDDLLAEYVASMGVDVFRGSAQNVFSRFVEILKIQQPDYFLRLTADCPIVMPEIIDSMIEKFEVGGLDYLSNTIPPTFPDGLDVEIISSPTFLQIDPNGLKFYELEHVTPSIYEHKEKYSIGNFRSIVDLSAYRWTVDYPADLDFVRNVYRFFSGKESTFSLKELILALETGSIENNQISNKYRNIAFTRMNLERE